jgi:hypothetical protein
MPDEVRTPRSGSARHRADAGVSACATGSGRRVRPQDAHYRARLTCRSRAVSPDRAVSSAVTPGREYARFRCLWFPGQRRRSIARWLARSPPVPIGRDSAWRR